MGAAETENCELTLLGIDLFTRKIAFLPWNSDEKEDLRNWDFSFKDGTMEALWSCWFLFPCQEETKLVLIKISAIIYKKFLHKKKNYSVTFCFRFSREQKNGEEKENEHFLFWAQSAEKEDLSTSKVGQCCGSEKETETTEKINKNKKEKQ